MFGNKHDNGWQMILNSIIENKVILYILNKNLLPVTIIFITILITGIQLTEKEAIHLCLTEIENMLQANRKRPRDFPSMKYPIGYAPNQDHNKLIFNEMAYDKQILAAEFNRSYHLLTGICKFLHFLFRPSSITIVHITNS